MMEEKRMVLKRPRKESAMKAPNIDKTHDIPTHMLTSFAAVGVGSWSSFVRYVMRFPIMPKKANRSATSTTAIRRSSEKEGQR
jgi:hypothetical protein